MLREFEYRSQSTNINDVLCRFNIDLPEHIAIVRFEVITPDSFMWRLLIGDGVYYLYAEDYVPGLDYIKSVFNKYVENNNWELVKPKPNIKFDDATPVKRATIYQKLDDTGEMMQYAVDSGFDFVFLARSEEDADNAQFSDWAPRGFNIGLVI